MPIYKYKCSNCLCELEKFQKFSEDPLKVCPECGQETLHKVYLPVGIVFKGSGFYATDHRSPSGQSNHHSEPAASDKGEKSTSSDASSASASTPSETKSSQSETAPAKAAEPAAKS